MVSIYAVSYILDRPFRSNSRVVDALFLLPDDGAPDRFGSRLRGWLLKAIQQIGNSK